MSDGWQRTATGWRKTYGQVQTPVSPGNFPCPRVMGDTMPLTEHLDGKHYDSKSAYRAVTKAHGYVEVGNDPARLRQPEKKQRDTRAVDAAIHKAIAAHT